MDGWWACRGCFARGPGLNKRNCINPLNRDEDAGDDDRHRHKRRRTDVELEGGKSDEAQAEDDRHGGHRLLRRDGQSVHIDEECSGLQNEEREGMQEHAGMPDVQSIHRHAQEHRDYLTNKQARKRAEEKHNQVNENKRRKHIEAHQKIMNLRFPGLRIIAMRKRMNRPITHSSTAKRLGRKQCSKPNKFRCTKEPKLSRPDWKHI